MQDLDLFKASDGSWITSSQVLSLLETVGAPRAEVLYMHTGLTFGLPNPQLSRQDLLHHVYELIVSLAVPTICFPTFTFSFCNNEDYCVQTSRSRMGALNEYIRKLPSAIRSVDPLLSSALIGDDIHLVQDIGKNSIGQDSTFDRLHRLGSGVKFMFFGTTASECFTYTHYVEERLNVSYRYNRSFTGCITDRGRTWKDTYTLFVRYKGVVPSSNGMLENYLISTGHLKKESCGDSSISCIAEQDGFEAISRLLRQDVHCYIDEDPGDRNTEFLPRNMVAL